MPRIIVTGCGRAGTQYTARLLSSLGLETAHERVFSYDLDPTGPCWELVSSRWGRRQDAEVSWMAAPFLAAVPPGVTIWHQLRDPLKVVRCWAQHGMATKSTVSEFVQAAVPECRSGSDLERAVAYVLRWGEMAEHNSEHHPCYHRYRVEDLTADRLHRMLGDVGFPRSLAVVAAAVEQVRPGLGACAEPHREVTWADVEACPLGPGLRAWARGRGYGD